MSPTFLFGSGISPAPNVRVLTDFVLSACMRRHGDGIFRLGDGDNCFREERSDNPDLIRAYLQLIRDDIAAYQRRPLEDVSYEDIANVCVQLDKESGSLRNPVVAPYREGLSLKITKRFPQFPQRDFSQLCWSATDWIQWAVYHALSDCTKSPAALQAFLTAMLDDVDQADVITLNHDTYLEHVLGARANLGFRSTSSDIQFFVPERLSMKTGIRVLKLHGSVDWFWHAESGNHRRLHVFDPMEIDAPPSLLAGTISKLESYNFSIFPWLWAEFQNVLQKTRRIVISGYGFKDVGVNARLSDWLNRNDDAKLVVIHGEPENLIQGLKHERIDAIVRFFQKSSTVTLDRLVVGDTIPNAKIIFVPVWFEGSASNEWISWLKKFWRE